MEEYRLADERDKYSKAYSEYRYEIFRENFIFVVIIFLLVCILLVWSVTRLKRFARISSDRFASGETQRMSVVDGLGMSLGVIFNPVDTFETLKNGRGRLNYIPGLIIFAAAFATRLVYLVFIHYPFELIDLQDSNVWLEMVIILLPPLTWIAASYAITSIMDGESKIDEIFLASSFCMVPYILLTGSFAVLSNVLCRHEKTIYTVVLNSTAIWTLLLFFISIKTLNNYKFFKSVATYSISGVTIALMWFLGLLSYVLTGRLFQFISGIAHEIRMTWL